LKQTNRKKKEKKEMKKMKSINGPKKGME